MVMETVQPDLNTDMPGKYTSAKTLQHALKQQTSHCPLRAPMDSQISELLPIDPELA